MPYNVAIKAYGATTELIVDNFADPPTGPVYKVWNGTTFDIATPKVWNGTTLDTATPSVGA